MNDRILIRSSESRWPAFLVGGAGGLLILTGVIVGIAAKNMILGLSLGGIGLLMVFASIFMEAQRIRQMMWITLEQSRFTITDNIGERSFHDDDIVSIALQYKDNFDNGNHTSTTRTFRVWVVSSADRPELIEMKSKIKVGEGDPLQGFINRIVKLLKQRADDERLKNQSVLGEGWELNNKTLLLRNPKQGEMEVQLQDIVAIMSVEDKLKFWRTGEDASFASIPLDAANAHLLMLLLEEELARRPEQNKEAAPAGQLGRIIFERKPKAGIGIALLIVAGLLGLVSAIMVIAMMVGAVHRRDADPLIIMSICFTLIGVLLALGAWITFKTLFRCHEYGVYLRGLLGEKQLLYSEVEAFTYSATRHYHNGAYIGTHLKLSFLPRTEVSKPKIVYKTTVKNVDSSLDQMRDNIAQMIGARMYQEVKAGKSVKWNDVLTLEPGQLHYIASGFFSKSPPQTIAYPLISSHNLQQGSLSLFQRGKPKPFVTASSTTQNFFPGYFAFLALWEEARAQPAAIPVAQDVTRDKPGDIPLAE